MSKEYNLRLKCALKSIKEGEGWPLHSFIQPSNSSILSIISQLLALYFLHESKFLYTFIVKKHYKYFWQASYILRIFGICFHQCTMEAYKHSFIVSWGHICYTRALQSWCPKWLSTTPWSILIPILLFTLSAFAHHQFQYHCTHSFL